MGKYMRKAKITGDVAVMEVSQSSIGVRTRAKTLALKGLQTTSAAQQPAVKPESSYLVLRSRRLEKPPLLKDIKKQQSPQRKGTSDHSCGGNPDAGLNLRLRVSSVNSGSNGSVSGSCCDEQLDCEKELMVSGTECDINLSIEVSYAETNLHLEGRDSSTRESTPCSLIRDTDNVRAPGSTTRQTSFPAANRRRLIPTAHELEEFFACAEHQLQHRSLFIEKYNFDITNDLPLPGRYEWVPVHL